MFCPKCKAEYREGFLKCADCGVDLVSELPPEPEQYTEYEYINLVNVRTYPSRIEAELVKGMLSANGIDADIQDGLEAAGGADPTYGLLVKEEDIDETNKIINEMNE
ncbi:MAG: DUF2007 domain-containing protein [Deltaproteobacteria bacterium]|nr:DUF2007 domain-containing protein [Deltaproteobacteria bacterium]